MYAVINHNEMVNETKVTITDTLFRLLQKTDATLEVVNINF